MPLASTLAHPRIEAGPVPDGYCSPNLELIGAHELAVGYGAVNLALGVPLGTQRRVDEHLWNLGQKCARTASHGRRAGGYAGAIVRGVGGTEFANDETVGLIRVVGGIHDIGKIATALITLHRTFQDEGYGEWDEAVDLPEIWKHPEDGAEIVDGDSQLPEESYLLIGCHHAEPDPYLPHRPTYGFQRSRIDEIYKNQPQARIRAHFLLNSLIAADIYDARTSRLNSYVRQGDGVYNYMVKRLQPLFPNKWERVLEALQQERHYYLQAQATEDVRHLIAA